MKLGANCLLNVAFSIKMRRERKLIRSQMSQKEFPMNYHSRRSFIARIIAGTSLAGLASLGRAQTRNTISASGFYTILSFCGGGLRGLASATLLNELYAQFPTIILRANMLAGTSTGAGIIAKLATGQSPSDIITNFLTEEKDFFKLGNFIDPAKPAYSIKTFAKGLHASYPDQTLASITNYDLLMTSFNLGDASTPWQPILFHNFPGSPNADTLLADAVVSSGAMPGMFGAYQFASYPQGNVDGAFVNHDPTLAAIALAVNAGVSLEKISVICFGTGFMGSYLGTATGDWGAKQWQTGYPNNPDSPYNLSPLLVNGKPSPIMNISLNGTSTNLIPELAGMLLPGRYAYLNPILDRYIAENDTKAADLEYLQEACSGVDLSTAEAVLTKYWH
jgi:predicted acylesterase/phospholipase RssA